MKTMIENTKQYNKLACTDFERVYEVEGQDFDESPITVAYDNGSKKWCFMSEDRIWWFDSFRAVSAVTEKSGFIIPLVTDDGHKSGSLENKGYDGFAAPYQRVKNSVIATGNRWAIENFNATH